MKWRITSGGLANSLIAAVVLLAPFHAFLTIWASTFVGHFLLLRLWDDLLLGLLCAVVAYWFIVDGRLRKQLQASLLVRLIFGYCVLTGLMALVAVTVHAVTAMALGYGLLINLRFLVWLVCVWAVATRTSWLRMHWMRLVFVPLAVVTLFGLLQFFVLPHDFLTHVGYGPHTYAPFITINQDSIVMRIQSFLRGANPLGAYLAALIPLLAALLLRRYRLGLVVLLGLAVLALVLTFSRSGWLAMLAGAAVVAGAQTASRRRVILGGGVALVITVGLAAFAVAHGNTFVQDALLHVSEESTAAQTSNEQHQVALRDSVYQIVREPLGRGPGTSGQASWYNTGHPIRNTESDILQVGEEVGWLGLGLFVAILVVLGRALWERRGHALALGLCGSLVGMVIVGLLSYGWSDDTLAFVWWGLAGIALALPKQTDASS